MTTLSDTCTAADLAKWLDHATEAADSDASCLEGSRKRERDYTQASLYRWHEIVQRLLTLRHRQTCLDIGTSPFTFVLPRFFHETHTLDYSDMMATRCASAGVRFHLGGITLLKGDVTAPVPADMFDCILCLEVLEHLHLNPVDILRMLQSRLKPGGTLILSTPNMMSLGNRIRMLMNRKLNHFSYPPFADNQHPQHGHGHDRIYMPAELREYLASTGWHTYRLGYHGLRVSDRSRRWSLGSLLAGLTAVPLKAVLPSLRQLILIEAQR